jgi:hypothetical protein
MTSLPIAATTSVRVGSDWTVHATPSKWYRALVAETQTSSTSLTKIDVSVLPIPAFGVSAVKS